MSTRTPCRRDRGSCRFRPTGIQDSRWCSPTSLSAGSGLALAYRRVCGKQPLADGSREAILNNICNPIQQSSSDPRMGSLRLHASLRAMLFAVVVSTIVLAAMAISARRSGNARQTYVRHQRRHLFGRSGRLWRRCQFPRRLAAGTTTCDRQITERLGSAELQSYLLSQRWYTYAIDGPTFEATVARVAEVIAGERSPSSVACRTPTAPTGRREANRAQRQDAARNRDASKVRFVARPRRVRRTPTDLWSVSKQLADASLPEGYIAEPSGRGNFRVHFDFDALALDRPSQSAARCFCEPP